MTTVTRLAAVYAAAVLFIACTAVNAGVVFNMEDTSGSNDAEKPRLTKVMAQDGKVKIQTEGTGSAMNTMIFDGEAGEMMMIDPEKRTYTVIDGESLQKIADSMRQMQEQMDAALAQVPPAQREQMKKMMGGSIPGMGKQEKAPEVTVKATGKSREVGDYKTKGYDMLVDGKKQLTLWVTQWDNVKGSREAQESMQSMGEFFSKMFESVPGMGSAAQQSTWLNAMKEVDGFPVQTVHYDESGKEVSTSTLKGVETQEIKASEFAPPKGYKRQSLGMGGKE